MAITEAQLRTFESKIPDSADLVDDLAAARAMMAEHLDAAGFSTSLSDQIELRLAAHFVAIRYPDLRLTSEQEGDARAAYGGKYGEGLDASIYGQAAKTLDPTGTLSGLGASVASFRVL